jgi:flavin reductase (DIM6/NTAB) family NADH-FMN oxidoreductase RutF
VSALSFDSALDAQERRRLLWAMPAGIYVLGTTGSPNGPFHLMTHSLVVQAATEPCVLALAVERTAKTHGLLVRTGVATLTVLRRDQRELARKFVKPDLEVTFEEDGSPRAIAGVEVALAPSGAPFLPGALGSFDLRRLEVRDFESHTLFLMEVAEVAVSPELLEGTPSARLAEVLRMEDTKMNYGG